MNPEEHEYQDVVESLDALPEAGEGPLEATKTPGSNDSISEPTEQAIQIEDDPEWIELAQPFVGRWNRLISTTNWEKGQIISEWRAELIGQGVPANQFSDEAWARRVGGVTAPHVGRLRRVHDRFGSTHATYSGIFWSHFLAALDWDDAPMWLEGASLSSWSVSQMREQRWHAHGALDSNRPTASQIVEVDLDEDVVLPAQGGGRDRAYDDDEYGISAGPMPEGPDFGEVDLGNADELSVSGTRPNRDPAESEFDTGSSTPVQPFVGLPELPDDLNDSIESLKLSILRHKSDQWRHFSADDMIRYLDALKVLVTSS